MIDTAQAYQNEGGVGRAIQKSGIKREDIFVFDKIWFSQCRSGQDVYEMVRFD